jgi:hypothetical protein
LVRDLIFAKLTSQVIDNRHVVKIRARDEAEHGKSYLIENTEENMTASKPERQK